MIVSITINTPMTCCAPSISGLSAAVVTRPVLSLSFIFPSHHPSILPSFWFPPSPSIGYSSLVYISSLHVYPVFSPPPYLISPYSRLQQSVRASFVWCAAAAFSTRRQKNQTKNDGEDTVSGDGQSWQKILWEDNAGWEGKRERMERESEKTDRKKEEGHRTLLGFDQPLKIWMNFLILNDLAL